MKGIFANHSPFLQLGILFVMVLTGFFISSFIIVLLSLATGVKIGANPLEQSILLLQSSQLMSALIAFLLPALFTAWLCSNQPKTFLCMQPFPHIRLLALVGLSMLLLLPIISLTEYFNSKMQLPASMAAIEEWMKTSEELADALFRKMTSGKGVGAFLLNLFIIAVVAGVTEEFLFRGALLRILRQRIKNHHIAIWIVAIIFSFIHFQFYGFIPRLLLGAYFGYLIYWTRNIWIPVFAHFFHNATAFIGMSNDSLRENAFFADEIATKDIPWLSITACICFIAFAYCAKIIRKTKAISRKER